VVLYTPGNHTSYIPTADITTQAITIDFSQNLIYIHKQLKINENIIFTRLATTVNIRLASGFAEIGLVIRPIIALLYLRLNKGRKQNHYKNRGKFKR
jgi:hypothetical protein